jgi:carbon-monoxide dehydrogenase medium subunit
VCVQLDVELEEARIALGSVAPTVVRADEAEAYVHSHWDAVDLQRAGRLAAAECTPIDDLRGSASYRRHAVEVLVRRALAWTLDARRLAA